MRGEHSPSATRSVLFLPIRRSQNDELSLEATTGLSQLPQLHQVISCQSVLLHQGVDFIDDSLSYLIG